MQVAMETASCVCGGTFQTNSAIGIAYGFNNPNFSDRLLKILVATDPSESKVGKSDAEEPSSRRDTTVHISSLLLASHSPFFYKMFSNGMKESKQQTVTLSVLASEESPLLDLLQFMYEGKLKSTTEEELMRVLILADRYQVVSCVTYCAQTLSSVPMTFELAASCITLPSSALETDNTHLQSLVDAATCYLSKNFISHRESALKLTLEGIQKILSWNTLEVDSEDDVYDFVLEWARTHYKDHSKRRQRAFCLQLCRLIRLPYMSCEKLRSITQSNELDRGDASKMVAEALLSKYENHPTSKGLGRAYRLQPVVVTLLHNPDQECIVYSELKKEKCATLIKNSDGICTQRFQIRDESFFLEFAHRQQKSPLPNCFAIVLHRNSSNSKTAALMITARTAVKLKGTCEYMTEYTSKCSFGMGKGFWYPIGKSWDSVIAEDSEYFIDGVLYVRLSITLHP